jgi:muramidase (phage lysozyme)
LSILVMYNDRRKRRKSDMGLWAVASGLLLGSSLLIAWPRSRPVPSDPPLVSLVSQTRVPVSDEVLGWRIVRAYIRTIAFAEGTWHPGRQDIDAYRTQALSYRQIPLNYAFKDHPYWHDRIIPCATIGDQRLCSACTGALQWHPDTYDAVRSRWKDKFWFNDGAFSPRNQDLAGIYKLQELGVWQILFDGIDWPKASTVRRSAFAQALAKSAPVWASLPRHEGDTAGHYGQGAGSIDQLYQMFQSQLEAD